jgi:beta-phosphoglucomutase-like phosphatase (HAD superfamily)
MPLHFEAYRRTFAEAGIALAEDDFYPHVGGNASETIPKFLRGRACATPIAALHARKKELLDDVLATTPLPVLATAQLLDAFLGHVKIGLASSGSRRGIDNMMRRLDWHRYFDAIITAEDAARGKPAPDLYLTCAQRLGVDAGQIQTFEDTDDGVAAATAAGMRCFDVRNAASKNAR